MAESAAVASLVYLERHARGGQEPSTMGLMACSRSLHAGSAVRKFGVRKNDAGNPTHQRFQCVPVRPASAADDDTRWNPHVFHVPLTATVIEATPYVPPEPCPQHPGQVIRAATGTPSSVRSQVACRQSAATGDTLGYLSHTILRSSVTSSSSRSHTGRSAKSCSTSTLPLESRTSNDPSPATRHCRFRSGSWVSKRK